MKTALFYGIAALLLSTSVYAIPNQPVCADEECSLAKLNTLRALASRGNKEINFSLGHIFMNPESGIQTDLENAFYYFSKSARLGFGPAYRQAAGMAAQGIGTQKDLTEAKRLMKEGADRGVDRTAEEYAVLVFTDPNSTKEERETAIAFLKEEVALGMSYLANYMLGILYIDGEYVPQDLDMAAELLAFPASGDYENSAELLAQLGHEEQNNIQTPTLVANSVSSGEDPDMETITITGLSVKLVDVHEMMLDQLRRFHGQTGSRIKGNGCTRDMPNCRFIESGNLSNHTFWRIR
ncbi:hypothetical protein KUL42_36740 [Alteromonas sp. KUL42]|uniref:tetratricopeptide repeat protein n=1 Tax=Alteromonas sp. KUL42 TaxID=2480797 RepID=UPI0010FFC4DD|nr:tetratricopeptide repeat protein [Alteromonas sp. KUL42]GEA08913.1 hypothetical protein KUL42_36740 [Alteromonas sp. KUL42]